MLNTSSETICENSVECSEHLNKENIKETGCVRTVILSFSTLLPQVLREPIFLTSKVIHCSAILFLCLRKLGLGVNQ